MAVKPKRFEHLPLRRCLPLQIGRLERHRQVRIVRRIPLIVIDSVQNPDEVGGSGPQDAVEAESELRRLNLLRRTAG